MLYIAVHIMVLHLEEVTIYTLLTMRPTHQAPTRTIIRFVHQADMGTVDHHSWQGRTILHQMK